MTGGVSRAWLVVAMAVMATVVLIAGACDGSQDETEPSIPIEVSRPGDAPAGSSPAPTSVAQAQEQPTSDPNAEPTPRNRVALLLTPQPSPTVPAVLQGLYGSPVPTPVPQGQLDPKFKEHYRQGELHMIEGRKFGDRNDYETADEQYRAAATSFSEAIAIHPLITESHTSRGSAYLELAQWEDALADFEEAMRLNHSLVSPFAGQAIAYRMMGMEEKAEEYVEAAIFNGMDKNILAQYLDGTVKRLRLRP
jgi:hypothetical protein